MENSKILLIDSDRFIKIMFKDTFTLNKNEKGDFYEIEIANDLETANKMISDSKPALIFIEPISFQKIKTGEKPDYSNSINFIKEIKSNPELKDIPIITYSAHSNDVLKEATVSAGAADFIVKGTMSAEELVSLADKLIRSK